MRDDANGLAIELLVGQIELPGQSHQGRDVLARVRKAHFVVHLRVAVKIAVVGLLFVVGLEWLFAVCEDEIRQKVSELQIGGFEHLVHDFWG